MNHPMELEAKLAEGEARAKVIAQDVLGRVRRKLGFE
jgi:tryptophanyl-tRNA synthetase